jgi:hypothetical protein
MGKKGFEEWNPTGKDLEKTLKIVEGARGDLNCL